MAFPLLFKITNSTRHDVLLMDSSQPPAIKDLNKQITGLISSSPNCEEFMSKYKAEGGEEIITGLKVRWADTGRDTMVWPKETIVTQENWRALVKLLEKGVGRDVLEVEIGRGE
ncbi:hypothetical protein GQ43DRAFT_380573 [Delitschia confertaspora ATCC 74209]|uniref:Uncharacterized protein n=1 Tax=Delitschia confertaspora ATCC 74209 TaxID=1513339 RepID=A0A9P4JDU7_9PLEO|nr:hypothetical protein GQ43DRAFT_380573 [Delitschia confertaspora ATCC 74209]